MESKQENKKSHIKILVVDDREDNLMSIETILEKDGYTIRKATSGRAALKILLVEQDFTLILMDVQMPEMSGFETASLIYQREKLKHIPVIFITAHNHDEKYMFEGYKMGAVDFIYKPINPDLLRFKVSVFVELYQKTHELMTQEKVLKAVNTNLEREIEERKISEEKIRLLNSQLLQNNDELKAINEELDRFAYVASHDLQEPLRKIMIFSDVIAAKVNDRGDEDLLPPLSKITKASERMQKLINDLLKFSRHANSNDEYALINLNSLLSELIVDVDLEIRQKDARIIYDDLPVIWGVPSQIYQLFQNLLSNSLKFSKDSVQPVINIQSKMIEGPLISDKLSSTSTYHQIIIEDNGIGFDAKYADEIFVVFKRLHSYHEFEGTGIGLSICKKIIDRHHGFIKAEGKPGIGATFTITLPHKSAVLESLVNKVQLQTG
ncbi:MAG TPA: response regulator [Chitinophagaceae bacterium]